MATDSEKCLSQVVVSFNKKSETPKYSINKEGKQA